MQISTKISNNHWDQYFSSILWTNNNSRDSYNIYKIIQNRKYRTIEEPNKELKEIQRTISEYIYTKFNFGPEVASFIGRGTIYNQQMHQNAKHIFQTDIKNCYYNITPSQVIKGLETQLRNEPDVLRAISRNCFIESSKRPISNNCLPTYYLPTGAPSSPVLCNIALVHMDQDILSMLAEYPDKNYKYTRYIDDITISTTHNTRDWEIIDKIRNIIISHNHKIKESKTFWLTPGSTDNVIVTGYNIGRKNKIPKSFRKKLRAKLQNLAKNKLPLDKEAEGCLAYVMSIDKEQYELFISYYHKRLKYDKKSKETNQ